MKRYLTILFFVLPFGSDAQLDSLQKKMAGTTDGAGLYKISRDFYNFYEESNRDSALHYAELGLSIAKKHGKKIPETQSLINKGYQLVALGRFAEALRCLLDAFAIANNLKADEPEDNWDLVVFSFKGDNKKLLISYAHHIFGLLMLRTGNVEQQIFHFTQAATIGREIGYGPREMLAYMNLGQVYFSLNKPDSVLYYERLAEETADRSGFLKFLGIVKLIIGDVYNLRGDHRTALTYYYQAVRLGVEQNNQNGVSRAYLRLARFHIAAGNSDSALYYARLQLEAIQSMGLASGIETNMGVAYEYLYKSYQLSHQFDSAFKYQGLALVTKDSLNNTRIKNLSDFQKLTFDEQLRLQNLDKEKELYQNRMSMYALLAGLGVFLLIALILYRNNRQKHEANKVLEQTLTDLQLTQAQLVQSEKMASLGELTAGIAHEIQNPLNFVNNFSEVNLELLAEMNGEISKENYAEIGGIIKDLTENEQKINHHGKRADAIVKGMLQHSRSSSGTKEPTDINALTDEYLRLAYHGLRAKDKSFNATLRTDFDQHIGQVNVIPQDIGRVILNLITNAFYAVAEKKKQQGEGYEPTVSVRTRKQDGIAEISVSDNGNGIPGKIIDKIFQPFFTTKPTGKGTGLGLSLSYDITKAHGGNLRVTSNEGEGTTFIVSVPV
ncbi:MAG: hypothetical protein JWQ78_1595 [Sediminibacterium sp.]|nr:hypothetical protein [Sediminibacterium sp.]